MKIKIDRAMDAFSNFNGYVGNPPTNETEFLARFHKVVSVDADNNATTSNDPSKFGVTWSQIKTEMDKL
jgi:hypothetical protein